MRSQSFLEAFDNDFLKRRQRSFYLVQTFISSRFEANAATMGFDDVFYRHNMSASEFSKDAYARFVQSMAQAACPVPVNSWIPFIRRSSARSTLDLFTARIAGVTVYGAFDNKNNTLKSVLAGIQAVAENKVFLKRNADFPPQEGQIATTAWAELRLGVFWSLDDYRQDLAGLFSRAVANPGPQFTGNNPKR
jgi:hypothetical protein